MGYSREAIVGISWVGAFRVASRVISFARIAVIARILTPAQFGLFGVASLILALVEILTETGINILLVQEKDKLEKYIDTAWIISILRGCIISLVIFIAAPLVALFFNSEDAVFIVRLIALVPLIRGFINPSIVKYQKELQFNKEFYLRTSVFFIDALAAVLFVYILQSPIGIVWGMIIGAAFEVAVSQFYVQPRPRIRFDRPIASRILHRGKWLTGAYIASYFYQNGDNIAVGRMLGVTNLGLYDAAYKISILPITEVGDVIIRVAFPLYMKINDDKERLRRAFIRQFSAVAALVIPIGIIIFIIPEIIIQILLGPQWMDAVPVLRYLAFFGTLRSLTNTAFPLFLSVQKQEYVTAITITSLAVLAITIVPLVFTYGIVGAAISALLGTLAAIPLTVYYLRKVLY